MHSNNLVILEEPRVAKADIQHLSTCHTQTINQQHIVTVFMIYGKTKTRNGLLPGFFEGGFGIPKVDFLDLKVAKSGLIGPINPLQTFIL